MELVAGKKFGDETVELAGKRFQGCTFNGSTLSFDGRPFQLVECVMKHCQWQFNDAAHVTLQVLNTLWTNSGNRDAIVGAFTQITGSKENAEKMARLRRID